MRTDSELLYEAMDILVKAFGPVDTARFISLIKRDAFDYTEWRRGKTPKPGGWEGKIWMADDFDAPRDDFREYME